MRIGLLGGSFNPPHEGHVHISHLAMQRLHLDCVWWVISRQNPLKTKVSILDYHKRMELCRHKAQSPFIVISDIETQLQTRYTYLTIHWIKQYFSQAEFVWLAGEDIAREFHHWYKWQELLEEIPFAFFARPPYQNQARTTHLGLKSTLSHHYPDRGQKVPLNAGNIYWIKNSPTINISSTHLRNAIKTDT